MALEVASFGSYTFAFGVHEAAGFGLMASGYATATYHAQDISFPRRSYSSTVEKRHTPEQEILSDLVKETGKKGVSNAEADTLLDWAKEYDYPNRDDRGKPHWDAREGMDHIHLGPKHIPVNN